MKSLKNRENVLKEILGICETLVLKFCIVQIY